LFLAAPRESRAFATTLRKTNIDTQDPRVPPSALPFAPARRLDPRRSASYARFCGGGI
jgi:hypothetical protein